MSGDESAFPTTEDNYVLSGLNGLTKRELFAALIMGSILQGIGPRYWRNGGEEQNITHNVEIAVEYADALIAELEKK